MSLRNPNRVQRDAPKRIAIVIANPAVSTTTGWPVGFWWSELSHSYYAFSEAGYEVTLFSPAGGNCEADALSDPRDPSGYSRSDLISLGFLSTPELASLVRTTRPVAEIELADFDAILVAGGQSPMFSFEKAEGLRKKFVAFYEAGKLSVALCHGVAVLRDLRLSDGSLLVGGKTVTGFANIEEDFADAAARSMGLLAQDGHIMPWRIEDAMRANGANYIQAGLWRGFAVRDGNLITGQQNFSGLETARLTIEALGG